MPNIKPTYQVVVKRIAESQDGKGLKASDIYSKFILAAIRQNTETALLAVDAGEVDIDSLFTDFSYMIAQLQKAREAVQELINLNQ